MKAMVYLAKAMVCPARARAKKLPQQGFTLIEIMVALVIMAVIMVLAYQAFDGVLRMENRSKEAFLQENRRSLATSIVLNDFLHMRARPVRDQLGGIRNAYLAPSGIYAVEFTRGGLPDVASLRGGIQRLGYRVEAGKLLRTTWPTADAGAELLPEDQVLATGIDAFRIEQLGEDERFSPQWPPLNQNVAPEALPAMVRVTLVTEEGDEQVILIPGVQMDLQGGGGG